MRFIVRALALFAIVLWSLPAAAIQVNGTPPFQGSYGIVPGTSITVSAAGIGNYAPGDTITLTGGVATTQGVVAVTDTQAVSATVAAPGTGCSNGPQTMTGTTGVGTLFQASVTVSGNAITAVNSISRAGDYTTNPTSPTVEPVTGASCSGAQLNVVLGVLKVTVTNPGNYQVVPSSPVAQGSSTGTGTGATFTLVLGASTQGPQWHVVKFTGNGKYVPQTGVVFVDGNGGGGSGGGGQASANTSGGGGGGAGTGVTGYPLRATPGSALTITVAASVVGSAAGVDGSPGNSTIVTGGLDGTLTLVGGNAGAKGNSAVGGVGGGSGAAGGGGGSAGGAGGNVTGGTAYVSPGAGGGGGGSTGASAGQGGASGLTGRANAGGGNGGGGGGGASIWSVGGAGGAAAGNGTDAPANSGAGGGGAGANATISGAGAAGFVTIREFY